MLIYGITVCVDYSEHLEKSLPRWMLGAVMTVVTSSADHRTQELARDLGTGLLITDSFYEQGAFFNKGRAMQEARDRVIPKEEWHLFVDADVVPPMDWLSRVGRVNPRRGFLHGARRVRAEDGGRIEDRELAGFFQLFHSSDPRGSKPLQRNFIHAGNYDSEFMLRWVPQHRIILPLELVHYGEPGRNWCGVGKEQELAEIRKQRASRSWKDEVVKQ